MSHSGYLASVSRSGSGIYISTLAHSPSVLGMVTLYILNDFWLIIEQEIMENVAPSGQMVDWFQMHWIR